MASILRRLFRRKKQPPLVCEVALDDQGNPVGQHPDHQHTAACFIDLEPLAVVELFQSQSCQSCPPAIPGIHEGTTHPNIILLTYGVTIFDHTGWKDRFASSAWDQRQRAYTRKWNRTSLFTPHVVVNGVSDGSGAGGKTDVQEIVARARAAQKTTDWNIVIDANDSDVRIDTDKQEAGVYDILFVTYRSNDEVVKVGSGPNKGKKINHRNVVSRIAKVGEWTGGNLTVSIGDFKAGLKPDEAAVVIVQEGGAGGPIVAATKV
ncbi:uncharacterized protein DNG_10083 [Cephalotrichum gorgonifer]|uniref:DUF1223 domain-containing protein n=1 Tax=Cephalotrichum gorgonifer TaxID=2041049 RepID=A0AAE8N7X0_9PEZI|nr:uncharacterized protein DNG_10083 [Cephalotrichum gorgonifer]